MALTKAFPRMMQGVAVSVKDFGATGDGTTDDTDAVQAALAGSNHIFFPEGTYVITSLDSLVMDLSSANSGSIVGQNALLDFSSTDPATDASGIKITGNDDLKLVISGIQMIQQYVDADGESYGLWITSARELLIDDITISDFGYNLIIDRDPDTVTSPSIVERCSIKNSRFYRGAYTNMSVSGYQVTVDAVYSEGAGRPSLGISQGYGISVGGFYINVTNSRFDDNRRYNIDFRSARNIHVANNFLYNAGWYNIHAYNENDAKAFSSGTIINNTLDGATNSAGGIKIGVTGSSSTVDVRDIIISNNIIRNLNAATAGNGILVDCTNTRRPLRVAITDNFLYDNDVDIATGGSGIRIGNNAASSEIREINISRNILRESASITSSGANNVIISENQIESSVTNVLTTGIAVNKNSGAGEMALITDNLLITTNGSFATPVSVNAIFPKYDVRNNFVNGANIATNTTNAAETISIPNDDQVFSSTDLNVYQNTVTISGTGSSETALTLSGTGSTSAVKVFWKAHTGFSTNRATETGTFVIALHNESGTFEFAGSSPYTIPQDQTNKATSTHTLSTTWTVTATGSTAVLSVSATTNSGTAIPVIYIAEVIGDSNAALP